MSAADQKKMKAFGAYLKRTFTFRAKKSKYGTGLFALRDIKKGEKCVAGHPPGTKIPLPENTRKALAMYKAVKDFGWETSTESNWKKAGLTKSQMQVMQDFMCRGRDPKYVPVPHPHDLFYPGLYQFSNHSTRPNIKIDGHHFVALRNIKEGDEIKHDYRKICPDTSMELIF
jgi:hypothetical protein